MAKPVARSTSSALARRTSEAPVMTARRAPSTRLRPDTRQRTGRPSVVKTSDLTIWPTRTPLARAASSAVRVPSGNSRTSISRPAARAASTTRSEDDDRTTPLARLPRGAVHGPFDGAQDRPELRQADLFRYVLEDDLHRHVAADAARIGLHADEVGVEPDPSSIRC